MDKFLQKYFKPKEQELFLKITTKWKSRQGNLVLDKEKLSILIPWFYKLCFRKKHPKIIFSTSIKNAQEIANKRRPCGFKSLHSGSNNIHFYFDRLFTQLISRPISVWLKDNRSKDRGSKEGWLVKVMVLSSFESSLRIEGIIEATLYADVVC